MKKLSWKEVSAFLRYCKEKRGNSRSTLFYKAQCIKRFAKWLWMRDFLAKKNYQIIKDYVDKYKLGRGTHRTALAEEEIGKIYMEAKNPLFRIIIWFGINFGLRPGEIFNLKISDLDFQEGYVYVKPHQEDNWEPKEYKRRSIPMNKNQKRILRNWINHLRQKVDHNCVFHSITGKKLARSNLRYILNKVSRKVGIQVYPKKLRYTYA